MEEEKETEYLARGGVSDSKAYQTETVVCVVFMQKKETLIAVIELVCSSVRLKRSVPACDPGDALHQRQTHWSYCVKKLSAARLYSLSKHTLKSIFCPQRVHTCPVKFQVSLQFMIAFSFEKLLKNHHLITCH